ncbi:hypothetical protein [Nonomuraea africana]|uniref:hypothetical protein n=1 Tax=Nonomuraea africana TaxID=46171 RepID=UPI0033D187E6
MHDVFARLDAYGERYRLERALVPDDDWIACSRLLDPGSPELARVLEAERHASGQVSEHATALTVIAVYASRVTTAALLAWALEGVLVDVRPSNVALRLSEHHGFEAVGLREPSVVEGPVETLVSWVLDEHLLPLADALHTRTRAGVRQLHGGIAYGCAAAFCSASLRGGDADLLEAAYHRFMAAAGGGLDRLGRVVRLREGGREGLFYLRDTCCLYYTSAEKTLCASCCLDTREDRIANYQKVLSGLVA